MSQASQPGAAAAPVTAPPVPSAPPAPESSPGAAVAGRPVATDPAGRTMDTPQRLRLLSLGVMITGIVVGVVGALVFSFLAYSLYRAESDTAQLIRVQQIQTNLLTADATATNAFLVGGLEPPAQRAAYDQALSTTGSLIAEAARAQPADVEALAVLNQQVVEYAAAIEQARANNRQGLPVGSQYLRSASSELRSQTLPILDSLVSTNADRATDRMTVWVGWIFVVVALLALVAAVIAQVWLARRFRRTINVGMLASSVVLLLALVGGTIAVLQLSGAVRTIQDGSFASVNAAAAARIDANNAKSNESLTLIARGSGAAFETAWQTSSEAVLVNLDRLDEPLTDQWQSYVAVHTKIRALDDGGQWDAAVALATGSGPKSANTVFNAFDASLASHLEQVSRAASSALSALQPGLIVGAILLFAAGLGAALLGRRGVAVRLKEYR